MTEFLQEIIYFKNELGWGGDYAYGGKERFLVLDSESVGSSLVFFSYS